MSIDRQASNMKRPRLTARGLFVLAVVFLAIGPTVSFALGIPINLIDQYMSSLSSGVGLAGWGTNGNLFWINLLMSPVSMVIGIPFYGFWAETHLFHLAGWVCCGVILLATSHRGLRVKDAAMIGAAVVLVFPFLVSADSPLLTWGYPDAVFMAVAAAGGAALCVAFVRGWGARGLRRRIKWGWLA